MQDTNTAINQSSKKFIFKLIGDHSYTAPEVCIAKLPRKHAFDGSYGPFDNVRMIVNDGKVFLEQTSDHPHKAFALNGLIINDKKKVELKERDVITLILRCSVLEIDGCEYMTYGFMDDIPNEQVTDPSPLYIRSILGVTDRNCGYNFCYVLVRE